MTAPEWLPIRPELREEQPYGAPQINDVIGLNVNENPYGPSDATAASIAELVRAAALELNRYPDREATALRRELAGYLGH
ncbi:MAG: histidinol-phosphate transaminase, partial [Actinomycetales bacterium]|nr:histidinol-phosphate transaminase [Actinomycetales bacterium]